METETYVAIGVTFLAAILLHFGYALALSGGNMQRLWLARRAGIRILQDEGFAKQVDLLLNPPPPKVEKPSAQPLWLLTVLQRKGAARFLAGRYQGRQQRPNPGRRPRHPPQVPRGPQRTSGVGTGDEGSRGGLGQCPGRFRSLGHSSDR